MTSNLNKIALLKKHVKAYPDFPKPGIIFRDLFSIMLNVDSFKILRDVLVERVKQINKKVDAIVGLDSRGFLLGPILALEFSLPFVPVRKKGKLPGPVSSVAYTLEYSTDVFEIQKESLKAGQAVIIVDDLLATGGSLKAACDLMSISEVHVVECLVVMELTELNGRNNVCAPVHSILQY